MRPLVIIESPYASDDVYPNIRYARAACRDSIERRERPFASHLLYTQPGILNDLAADERKLGIELGYEFWGGALLIAFYIDKGWSDGMQKAFERCIAMKLRWEKRTIPNYS